MFLTELLPPTTNPSAAVLIPMNSIITLTCSSNGNVINPQYAWMDENNNVLSNTSVLVFENITKSQNGSYRCKTSREGIHYFSNLVPIFITCK